MELFLKNLIYNELSRLTVDDVLMTIRSLDWDDVLVRPRSLWPGRDLQVLRKLRNAFTKVWKIRYSNIQLLALLLHDLGRFHSAFAVDVVDQIFENVRSGLERNDYRRNQHRVATVRYLGELYNYRVVDAKVVFDALWMLVTFGHRAPRVRSR